VLSLLAKVAVRLFAQDAVMGATPTLFAATADVPGGSYAGPSNRRELAGPPVLVGRSAQAADPIAAARLWAASEELTGVRFPPTSSVTRRSSLQHRTKDSDS
jgi:hypothetical protein